MTSPAQYQAHQQIENERRVRQFRRMNQMIENQRTPYELMDILDQLQHELSHTAQSRHTWTLLDGLRELEFRHVSK